MEIIFTLCIIVTLVSLITFMIGFFIQFSNNEKSKKIGLKMILYSTIAFVIGFGTCYAAVIMN